MSKSVDLLTKRVRDALTPRGAPIEFVRKTGISRSNVQLWFKGPVNPTVETLDRIANALNTSPAALLDPGAPPVPAKVASLLPLLAIADDGTLNAIRDLLAGYAKRLEQSAPQDRQQLPNQRKKPGK